MEWRQRVRLVLYATEAEEDAGCHANWFVFRPDIVLKYGNRRCLVWDTTALSTLPGGRYPPRVRTNWQPGRYS